MFLPSVFHFNAKLNGFSLVNDAKVRLLHTKEQSPTFGLCTQFGVIGQNNNAAFLTSCVSRFFL